MKFKTFVVSLVCFVLLVQPIALFSFETDQYNLPKKPLADIGLEVTDYTEKNVREAIEKVNRRIGKIQSCLDDEACRVSNKRLKRLSKLRSDDAIAKAVFKEMGDGVIPFTKSGSWMEGHKFNEPNSRFKTRFGKSIYITAPTNYLTISSTVKLYDTEFGTDKIAHIFQQGFDYLNIYKKHLKKGLSEDDAIKKAVRWGKKTEKTYFGYWASGVYSNADLAANYAGLKFYIGLTKDIKIGDKTRPAILSRKDGLWMLNENVALQDELLKPFISKHLNEAYNPNKFFNLLKFRKVIKKVVRKRACEQWFERYPNLNKADLETTTKSLELWDGEDYGFEYSNKFITIANTCFEDKKPINQNVGEEIEYFL